MGAKKFLIAAIFQIFFCESIFSQLIKIEYEEFTTEHFFQRVNYFFDVQNKILISETSGYLKEHLYQYEIIDFVNKTIKKFNLNTQKVLIDTIKGGVKSNRMVLLEKRCDDNQVCELKYDNYSFNPFSPGDTSVLELTVEVDFKHELGEKLFKEFREYIPTIEAILDSERGIILFYAHRYKESEFMLNTYSRKLIGYSYVHDVFDFTTFEEVKTIKDLMAN